VTDTTTSHGGTIEGFPLLDMTGDAFRAQTLPSVRRRGVCPDSAAALIEMAARVIDALHDQCRRQAAALHELKCRPSVVDELPSAAAAVPTPAPVPGQTSSGDDGDLAAFLNALLDTPATRTAAVTVVQAAKQAAPVPETPPGN
jgi:hypothetical protein